ncbi:hypothetical protein [Nonomuraea dietziae]|uniref:hypothetical protein n=1 Tax=Nonomuraea dietziae TaxID=65515 RepID=UPI0031DE91AC
MISNVLVIDAMLASGRSPSGCARARPRDRPRRQPNTLDGVDVVVGTGTHDRLRRRADRHGGRDRHARPPDVARIMEASLASGVTTIIGQEFGPVWAWA